MPSNHQATSSGNLKTGTSKPYDTMSTIARRDSPAPSSRSSKNTSAYTNGGGSGQRSGTSASDYLNGFGAQFSGGR
ncbi:hypothetical protein TruAng_009855 [Truncatella angustata]|nr:hypothetical protein TruAng_009855 [Truncatella angustata]